MELSFSLDQLPVSFGNKIPAGGDREAWGPIDDAIDTLSAEILEEGGFQFRRQFVNEQAGKIAYNFYYAQDKVRFSKSQGKGLRDREQMLDCKSHVKLVISFHDRTMGLRLHHFYHEKYDDIRLSPAIIEYISTRIATSTPADIFRDLRRAGLPDVDTIAQHQVYYQWSLATSAACKRDPCPITSTRIFLEEHRNKYEHATFESANVRAVTMYVRHSIRQVVSTTKAVAMDSTYGTNNAAMPLFAVLAEYNGTGVPLAYLFVDVLPSPDGIKRADAGATGNVLVQFLEKLGFSGLRPSFFGCDKDRSEILAVQHVWPDAKIQLCFWHTKRAVQLHLKDANQSSALRNYHPQETKELGQGLEMCWGSVAIRRPVGIHRNGQCHCESRNINLPEKGRLEALTKAEKNELLEMFVSHFNMHPLLPDNDGKFQTQATIHRKCTTEMYAWCRQHNFIRHWAYMYLNWYKPEQWVLWARSTNASEIPVLETTMIVKSHWRKVKHDYIHRFNRPRIDLAVWILNTRLIPDSLARMEAITSGNRRLGGASWRKAFKAEWNKLSRKKVEAGSLAKRHPDPVRWTCACRNFLNSRFLIYKHLITCTEPIPRSAAVQFFSKV